MRSLMTIVYALAAAWAAFTLVLLAVPPSLAAVGGVLMFAIPVAAFFSVVYVRRPTT
jgi:hypothetical protein